MIETISWGGLLGVHSLPSPSCSVAARAVDQSFGGSFTLRDSAGTLCVYRFWNHPEDSEPGDVSATLGGHSMACGASNGSEGIIFYRRRLERWPMPGTSGPSLQRPAATDLTESLGRAADRPGKGYKPPNGKSFPTSVIF